MKKVAFVSSPIAYHLETNTRKVALEKINQNAHQYCRYAREQGYVPVSWTLCFLPVYTNDQYAFEDGLEVLQKCDVLVYRESDLAKSNGCTKELELAKELGLELVVVPEDYR